MRGVAAWFGVVRQWKGVFTVSRSLRVGASPSDFELQGYPFCLGVNYLLRHKLLA